MQARRVVAALALALLGACRVDVRVGVDAAADGTGRVEAVVALDEEARSRAPELEKDLRVDDLRAAGWTVTGPRLVAGGGSEVRAVHAFSDPSQLEALSRQLSGPDGPFRSFRLQRSRSLLRTRTEFTGLVDLGRGIEAFGDRQLTEQLGGSPLGADPRTLERQLGVVLARVFRVSVAARLPGSVSSNSPAPVDSGAVWHPMLGQTVSLEASSVAWNTRPIALLATAALAGLAAAAILLRQRSVRARRVRRTVAARP